MGTHIYLNQEQKNVVWNALFHRVVELQYDLNLLKEHNPNSTRIKGIEKEILYVENLRYKFL